MMSDTPHRMGNEISEPGAENNAVDAVDTVDTDAQDGGVIDGDEEPVSHPLSPPPPHLRRNFLISDLLDSILSHGTEAPHARGTIATVRPDDEDDGMTHTVVFREGDPEYQTDSLNVIEVDGIDYGGVGIGLDYLLDVVRYIRMTIRNIGSTYDSEVDDERVVNKALDFVRFVRTDPRTLWGGGAGTNPVANGSVDPLPPRRYDDPDAKTLRLVDTLIIIYSDLERCSPIAVKRGLFGIMERDRQRDRQRHRERSQRRRRRYQ